MSILPQTHTHPAWCSREACEMPTGELFHTADIAELDLADADYLDETVRTWLAIESTEGPAGGVPARIRLQLRPSEHHAEDRGLRLTPAQAVELGLLLTTAGRMAGYSPSGSMPPARR